MKSNLTTEAGRADKKAAFSDEQVDAINQVFALFQLNYHNQYFKAFSSDRDLNYIKRLWLESLSRFPAQTLLRAAKAIIEKSEFLPTLHRMIAECQEVSAPDMPEPHEAFIEACQAPSPKSAHAWSHPAVYHAGKTTDWFFLQNNPEHVTFPLFKQHYLALCEKVKKGEQLAAPQPPALPDETTTPLNREENRNRMKQLRDQLKI